MSNAAIDLLKEELRATKERADQIRGAIRALTWAQPECQEVDTGNRVPTIKEAAISALLDCPEGMDTKSLYFKVRASGTRVSNRNSMNVIMNRYPELFARHPQHKRRWICLSQGDTK